MVFGFKGKFAEMLLTAKIKVTFDKVCRIFGEKEVRRELGPKFTDTLKKSSYIVEATHFELCELWSQFKDQGFPNKDSGVYSVQIGTIVGEEIFIQMSFYEIKGKIICFYEMTGGYAFGCACQKFFNKVVPDVPIRYLVGNFHNIMSEL